HPVHCRLLQLDPGDAGPMKLKRKNSASLKPFALFNASWSRHLFPGSRHVVRRQRTGLQGCAQQNMAAVMIKPRYHERPDCR
ncbi:MAG: hypothetical protein PHP23_01375, partial [Desulfobacterales bacterium]|nr:hypothetical protein [Desulfobacterales bacterium]